MKDCTIRLTGFVDRDAVENQKVPRIKDIRFFSRGGLKEAKAMFDGLYREAKTIYLDYNEDMQIEAPEAVKILRGNGFIVETDHEVFSIREILMLEKFRILQADLKDSVVENGKVKDRYIKLRESIDDTCREYAHDLLDTLISQKETGS